MIVLKSNGARVSRDFNFSNALFPTRPCTQIKLFIHGESSLARSSCCTCARSMPRLATKAGIEAIRARRCHERHQRALKCQ